MQEESADTQQLQTGWRSILVIWGALFTSLGAYLAVALVAEKSVNIKLQIDFPLETVQYAVLGVSFTTFMAAFFIRRYLLNNSKASTNSSRNPNQHPAVARYAVVTVLSSALMESIGIYGLMFFLLFKDFQALYGLIAASALGMVVFRPRKAELFDMAEQMREYGEK